MQAFGGPATAGGAGTIYLQGPGRETGEVILDNNGLVAAADSTPLFTIPAQAIGLADFKITRGARAKAEDPLSVADALEIVTPNGIQEFMVEAKRTHLTRAIIDGVIAHRAQHGPKPWILFAPHVGRPLAKYLGRTGYQLRVSCW